MEIVWKLAMLLKGRNNYEHIGFIAEVILEYLSHNSIQYSEKAITLVKDVLATIRVFGTEMRLGGYYDFSVVIVIV